MKGNCCQHIYDTAFDFELAEKELADYLKKGIKKSSKTFLKVLQGLPVQGHSHIDIGSGIGAVIFEMNAKGTSTSTHIDISEAYSKTFRKEAERRQLSDTLISRKGDFIDLHHDIDAADLVTLDKVICCYEHYEALVKASLPKAKRWYVYSVPRDVWWVRWVHGFEQWVKTLRKKEFRTYIHPTSKINRLILNAGFRQLERRFQREWVVFVFERK